MTQSLRARDVYIDGRSYRLTSDDLYLESMGPEFEPDMIELFKALIVSSDIVADIGANIGMTSIFFSTKVKQVFAFEASSSTFNILQHNVSNGSFLNLEVLNVGLGDKDETQTITFAESNRSGGFISDTTSISSGHITETVVLKTLDNLILSNTIEPPSFLKIDVEGFELKVLQGGNTFLRETKPTVVLELNHFCLNVLHRITVPDFLDSLRQIFPFLFAVDTDNCSVMDLNDAEESYEVMYQHVLHFRFPNIVAGFSPEIEQKLRNLEKHSNDKATTAGQLVSDGAGKIKLKSDPKEFKIGEARTIDVTVINASKSCWFNSDSNPLCISYHWHSREGDNIIHDGVRTRIPWKEIDIDKEFDLGVVVEPPSLPGTYVLVATLVQEGNEWFEDIGFDVARVDILVT
jgi:FkbM family methyltransferase